MSHEPPPVDYLDQHAGEALRGLLAVLRFVTERGGQVPTSAVELARALHARDLMSERASEAGNRAAGAGSMDGVRAYGTPDEAGSAVGLSGRRVRQLCSAGSVAHQVVGAGRYLVDINDLHRHLRGDSPEAAA